METLHENHMHAKLREMPQEKRQASNRKFRRSTGVIRHGNGGMFGRFLSRHRTGTPPHFAVWMADLKMKSALQRTSLASLADRHDSAVLAGTYGMLHVGGFRSVWDLTQADARDLLRVKGIGPKRLEDVKRDLVTRHVAVRW